MGIAKHPPSHFGLKHCQQIFSCEVLLKLFLVMHTDNDGIANDGTLQRLLTTRDYHLCRAAPEQLQAEEIET